jgi:hypothetical protein
MYFDSAFTSVYYFDTDFGFGAAFLIKKSNISLLILLDIEESKGIKEGTWDSIHVVSVTLEEKKAKYRVVSTVFLKMLSTNPSYGDLEIAGNISRSVIYLFLLIHPFRKKRLSAWMLRVVTNSIYRTSAGS